MGHGLRKEVGNLYNYDIVDAIYVLRLLLIKNSVRIIRQTHDWIVIGHCLFERKSSTRLKIYFRLSNVGVRDLPDAICNEWLGI